ncbi:hypothetical protein F4813DRAFT_359839 [Daldinia decipiens]|uniref:uncharacterized protein n=1 Tax=Daldinia decipiens TaxID=326647 RepID=UPI0020C1DD15|nr:uncharacterized protein F4813DRAFT_359839 [Daldinia decipiens]KAI1657425.1 hypothetical protein F4813DRAFT_359839 [Daldinia decipiens]
MSSVSSYSGSSCDSDAESVSSSVIYTDEEPFSTFQTRVLDFALHEIWPDATEEEISVERMAGGGENRIIGISRQPTEQPDTHICYIIRMPRFDSMYLNSQVATLRFLHQHSKIPAPDVIKFDATEDNELNTRYTIQTRLPGQTLLYSYQTLSHEERCRLARELGHVYSELLSTRSAMSGVLVLPIDGAGPLELLPWKRPEVPCAREYSNLPVVEDIKKVLQDIFTAQKDYDLRMWPKDTSGPLLMDKFCKMAAELEADGWFKNCYTSLAHLDLEPRNVLVNPTSDTSSPIISTILDWDSAVFAPQFMCCKPPLWLWAWQEDEEEDERTANDEPPTSEGRQLKQLFEEAAGPDYIRLAYEPAYRLARQLVQFAIGGVGSNMAFKEAEEMLEEWRMIHHEDREASSLTKQIGDCHIGDESSSEQDTGIGADIMEEESASEQEEDATTFYENATSEQMEDTTISREESIGTEKDESVEPSLKEGTWTWTRAGLCIIL